MRLLRKASIGLAVAVIVATAVALYRAGETTRNTTAVTVIVEGRPVEVAQGTTLATLARRFMLRPRAGELLDVTGNVLEQERSLAAFSSTGTQRRLGGGCTAATGSRSSTARIGRRG